MAFREYCLQSIETIKWNQNTTFPDSITVTEAVDLIIFHDKDAGKAGAYQLMPASKIYNEWATFYRYIRCAEVYLE